MTGKNVTWVEPGNLTVSESSYLNVKGSHFPGTEFPVGVTWVNYTLVDSKKRSLVCNFSITVLAGKVLIRYYKFTPVYNVKTRLH